MTVTDDFIGRWASRLGLSRAHWVDSTVAGDIFTRCGRRIAPKSWDGGTDEIYIAALPLAEQIRCRTCKASLAASA